MVEYVLQRCAADGLSVPPSINPVVCECNDARLSDIRKRAVSQQNVFDAIAAATADFEEGAVGAGRGTVCHGLKGGIGTASRLMEYDGKTYTLGVLVQSNYGRLSDLRIDGRPVGREIASGALEEDKGSIIVVMGTDLPLSDRQIKRVLRRAGVGLARVGSFTGHGSGEVFVGFSTANAMDDDDKAIRATESFREDLMNGPFRAMAEATEEAVLNSMSCSVAVGDVKSLADYLPRLLKH
jgi:D-aminopeptidase